ncbi:Ig-like domain-containing protein [Streptomyces natalensis]|uniref:Ig-like domain-containing protein n=1 Tax=Streptomyces natalensis TaxID=68242 RepID=UPI0012FEB057|nr:Ig-like domain-containing protein [Streptomyces natalensis]
MSRSPSAARRRMRCGALALVSLLGAGALTGCGSAAASASERNAVQVGLGAAGGTRTVQTGDRLQVTARGGVLTEVTVTDPRGHLLSGALDRGDTVWTSRARAAPATKYSVVARTKDARGAAGEIKESVTTAADGRETGRANGPPAADPFASPQSKPTKPNVTE